MYHAIREEELNNQNAYTVVYIVLYQDAYIVLIRFIR